MSRYIAILRRFNGDFLRAEFDAWPTNIDAGEVFAQFPGPSRTCECIAIRPLGAA